MSSSASFKVVKDELESTVQEAQTGLENFIADPGDVTLLQSAIDLVNQVRGTFVIIEDKGAALLCEELARLLTELPTQEVVDQTPRGKSVSDAISSTLVIVSRYLEYLAMGNQGRPELLIPTINQVLKARNLAQIRDSNFFHYKVTKLVKPKSPQPFNLNDAAMKKLRRYRHMYQASFLFLLRGQRTRGALKYMQRSVSQIDKIAANTPIASLFWIASGALECLSELNANVGTNRKLLLAQLDRQVKFLIRDPKNAFSKQPPLALVKDFLYIISLCQPKVGIGARIMKAYKLPTPTVSESELAEQTELLFSPGTSVMNSVSDALHEEIHAVKEMVDLAARSANSSFSAKALHAALVKIADILVMVGLTSPSNVLRSQADIVGGWADKAAPSTEQLLKIADAVLYAESAVSRLSKGGHQESGSDHVSEAARAQLAEARIVLIDEAESGISLAKRAITAFMDSEGDVMHLANVSSTLNTVKGGLVFLGGDEAASIVERCIQFIDTQLVGKKIGAEAEPLESLADALSSLEFYLESLLGDQNPDDDVLKVAREAISHLAA